MKSMGSDGEDEGGGPLMLTAVGAYATTLAYMLTTRLGKASKGATAVEYGLLVALIAAAIVASVAVFGNNLSRLFSNLATTIQ